MSYYAKTAIFLTLFFLYSYLAKELTSSNEAIQEQKALQHYRNSNYKLALAYLENLGEESNSLKSIFYQGYILREEEKLEKSTLFFKKALNSEKKEKTNRDLFEINFNLALNGYLMSNQKLFKESMMSLLQLKNSLEKNKSALKTEFALLEFFRGLEAFLEEDYEKALLFFKKVQKEPGLLTSGLSPWMDHSFQKFSFNSFWISKKIALCYIETSRFESAENLLDKLDQNNSIYFLKNYLQFKQNFFKLPHEISTIDENQKKGIFEEFKTTLKKIENEFLEARLRSTKKQETFSESLSNKISSHSLFLSLFLQEEALNLLASQIAEEIDEKLETYKKDEIIFLINQIRGKLYVKLLYKINLQLESALKRKEFEKISQLIALFQSHPKIFTASLPFLREKIKILILEIAKQKNQKSQLLASSLLLFSKIQPEKEEQFLLGRELIKEAEYMWQNEGINRYQNYENALQIYIETSTLFSSSEKKEDFLTLIEHSFSKLLNSALEGDQMAQHFHLLKGIKALNLNPQNKYDESIKKLFLEDAAYFFSRHLNEKALEIASFILLLEPENEQANQIVGLISYSQGNFKRAFEALKKIKKPEPSIIKILKSESINQTKKTLKAL